MANKIGPVIAMCVLAGVMMVGLSLFSQGMGSIEMNTNLSGSAYEPVFNTTNDIGQLTVTTGQFIPYVFIVLALVFAALILVGRFR